LAVCVIIWMPALRHNAAHDAPWILTTNAGVNFYAGNQEGSTGRFRPPAGVTFFETTTGTTSGVTPAGAQRALTTQAVAGTDRAADSAYWFGAAGTWIRTHPADYAALRLRKTLLVLQGHEIGQIESPAFHRQRLPALRIFWVGWSLVLSLAVVGFWSGLQQPATRQATKRLALLTAALLLPCVVFFVTARYRLVAVPLLCVLAGMGLTALLAQWRQQRRRFWISLLVVVAVFSATRIGGATSVSRQAWENAQMADRLYAVGQLDEAIVFLENAQRLQPQRLEVHLNLALYRSERGAPGDLVSATQTLRRLAARFPDHPIVLFNWARVLEQTGDSNAARHVYGRVLELDPSFDAARQRLQALEPR
jgi:tetratricopeptide (TPR) repeat protein